MTADQIVHTRAVISVAETVGLTANDVDEIVTLYHGELAHEIEHWRDQEDRL